MANPISDEVVTGTAGELLVQLRLLEYDVQAAPPIKDSGNDLIAIKGRRVAFIQVKTTKRNRIPEWPRADKVYDYVALVKLADDGQRFELDRSQIYLVPQSMARGTTWSSLEAFKLSPRTVEAMFPELTP